MKSLTAADLQAVKDVAAALGVNVQWLSALINFESAWDPQAKNPLSSARGLIQFIDKTAKDLGYANAMDLVSKNPTIQGQLRGPVLKYFRQWAPFVNEQDFYLSVFLPKYRRAPLDTVIYADDPKAQAAFRKANPKIITVGDYYNRLREAFKRIHGAFPASAAANLAAVLTVLGGFFF